MKPIILNADYFLVPDLMDFDTPVEIHATRFSDNKICLHRYSNKEGYKVPFKNPEAYKVLLVSNEPVCSPNKESIEDIIAHSSEYDLILCTDKEILSKCNNATLFPYGTTWLNKVEVPHEDSLGFYKEGLEEKYKDKTYQISFLCTGHRGMAGYETRRDVWNNKHLLKAPTKFWSSARTLTTSNNFSDTLHDGIIPLGEKDNLFYSQFSIIVENCVQPNYFSEKLIDCMLTKTVPIYFGCPNINEYFNEAGLLQFTSMEELISIVNNINENTYEELKDTIEENFNISKEYGRSFSKRIEEVIKDNLSPPEILLTLGILTIPQRKPMLKRLLDQINTIIPEKYIPYVEIILNSDNKEKSVGTKRNEVLKSAKGKYVCFADDDDLLGTEYFSSIIPELQKDIDVDCVGFYGSYYVKGQMFMGFSHANKNGGHYKKDGCQYRPANHLNPVRTSIAREIGFPELNYSEDADYTDRLFASGLIKKESNIEKVLYHYFYDPETTETQK